MINVTQSYLPSFEKYSKLISGIWENSWLTNNGPLVVALEAGIKQRLGVDHFLYTNNGTIVLQMALQALHLKGREVITTPFSYVATVNSILWEGATPVFADINDTDYNIDVTKIEEQITPATGAILATHVFGNPCDVEQIAAIGRKHNLAVIYDAAHAFGTTYKGQSLFKYGDISTCSFHATKIFHTAEGGGIFCNDAALYEKLRLIRQFGHQGDDYYLVGINGKASEFHAAMGLCVLDDFDAILQRRKDVSAMYDSRLDFGRLKRPVSLEGTTYNYSYYPVVFESESILLKIMDDLKAVDVVPRRYFYPSLNKLSFLPAYQPCAVSEDIAARILCLPLSHYTTAEQIDTISGIINNNTR